METKKQKVDALYTLIAGTQNVQQIAALFEDLCTVKELENMAERLYAAKLLLQGHTYAQILTEADISSATLSRVSRCVQYGKGYSQLLSKAFPADDPETPS
jgi:TrpR-related protein YerC/YecD